VGVRCALSSLPSASWRCYRHEDGTPTGVVERAIRYALRPLRLLDAGLPADDFGTAALERLRNYMVEAGLARRVVNDRVDLVKRMFRLAESHQLVARGNYHNLATLAPLKPGRTPAPERDPVEPVAWERVEATLPHLPTVLRAMVLLQWRTAMRPGEVVAMRETDIDKGAEDWIYRPRQHKSKHRGRRREVPLLAEARAILGPFLGAKREFLFVASGHKAKAVRYTTSTYAQAVRRGAAAASGPGRHEAILAAIPADVRDFFENTVRRLTAHLNATRLAALVVRIATRRNSTGRSSRRWPWRPWTSTGTRCPRGRRISCATRQRRASRTRIESRTRNSSPGVQTCARRRAT